MFVVRFLPRRCLHSARPSLPERPRDRSNGHSARMTVQYLAVLVPYHNHIHIMRNIFQANVCLIFPYFLFGNQAQPSPSQAWHITTNVGQEFVFCVLYNILHRIKLDLILIKIFVSQSLEICWPHIWPPLLWCLGHLSNSELQITPIPLSFFWVIHVWVPSRLNVFIYCIWYSIYILLFWNQKLFEIVPLSGSCTSTDFNMLQNSIVNTINGWIRGNSFKGSTLPDSDSDACSS